MDQKGDLTNNQTQNVKLSLGWEFPALKFSGWINYSLLEKDHLGWGTNFSFTPAGNCWGLGLRLWQQNNRKNDDLNWKLSFKFNYGPDPRTRKSLLTI